jgi:uncharacterized protein YukE
MESPELKAARQRLDDESTAIAETIAPIAARMDALAASLGNGMSEEEQAAAAANLSANADALGAAAEALKALGSTPVVP